MRNKYTGFGVRLYKVETLNLNTGATNEEDQKPLIPEKSKWDYGYYTNLPKYDLSEELKLKEKEILKSFKEFSELVEKEVIKKYSKMDFVKNIKKYT